MTARLECQTLGGTVLALCDEADLPRLLKWKWRYQAKRGVVTRASGSQMQATALLCGWSQVQYANGDKLDLRRANLVKIAQRGGEPKCRPMQVRENLWRVQRIVGTERLQLCFAHFETAVAAGERLRAMTKPEVLAQIARRAARAKTAGTTIITVEQFFDGRADLTGNVLDFEAYSQMSHAVNFE